MEWQELGMIGIIDYGMGNLHSVLKGFERVKAGVEIITDAAGIEAADKVVLPGVGAFEDAMATLSDRGLVEPIRRAAAEKPFLGICLGLQLLFDVSYENGRHEGLGIIPGEVVRFSFAGRADADQLKVPHMGWNSLKMQKETALYRGIPDGSFVYFVHSYYVVCEEPTDTATVTEHGVEFTSSIARGGVFATQFHPEKSQEIGLRMLGNFASL